jgi:hypothetical protein
VTSSRGRSTIDEGTTPAVENFKREMMRSKKGRSPDIYPNLSPELEQLFYRPASASRAANRTPRRTDCVPVSG